MKNLELIIKANSIAKEGRSNQDSFKFDIEKKYIVTADGMQNWSGIEAVKLASEYLDENLSTKTQDQEIPNILKNLMEYLNPRIINITSHTGTTFDVGIFSNSNFHFGHVGDSQIEYLNKQNKIIKITQDQIISKDDYIPKEVNNDIRMKIAQASYRFVPSNFLGKDDAVEKVQYGVVPNNEIKRVMFSTDGVYGLMTQKDNELVFKEKNIDKAQNKIEKILDNPENMANAYLDELKFMVNDKVIVYDNIVGNLSKFLASPEHKIIADKFAKIYGEKSLFESEKVDFIIDQIEDPKLKKFFTKYYINKLKKSDDATYVIIDPVYKEPKKIYNGVTKDYFAGFKNAGNCFLNKVKNINPKKAIAYSLILPLGIIAGFAINSMNSTVPEIKSAKPHTEYVKNGTDKVIKVPGMSGIKADINGDIDSSIEKLKPVDESSIYKKDLESKTDLLTEEIENKKSENKILESKGIDYKTKLSPNLDKPVDDIIRYNINNVKETNNYITGGKGNYLPFEQTLDKLKVYDNNSFSAGFVKDVSGIEIFGEKLDSEKVMIKYLNVDTGESIISKPGIPVSFGDIIPDKLQIIALKDFKKLDGKEYNLNVFASFYK